VLLVNKKNINKDMRNAIALSGAICYTQIEAVVKGDKLLLSVEIFAQNIHLLIFQFINCNLFWKFAMNFVCC